MKKESLQLVARAESGTHYGYGGSKRDKEYEEEKSRVPVRPSLNFTSHSGFSRHHHHHHPATALDRDNSAPPRYSSIVVEPRYYTSAEPQQCSIAVDPHIPYVNSTTHQPQFPPDGFRDFFSTENINHDEKRLDNFERMEYHASYLEDMSLQRIHSNKDRQETAIYVFTVVTVVFLPLSAVAGILGMNTNDIRNMELNQWVFWVISIPLAVIIITLYLVWTGESGNFRRGFPNLWRSQKREREYTGLRR